MPLPVMLQLDGRRCVVVGGGAVGGRRAAALTAAGAHVVVVAPEISDAARDAAAEVHARRWLVGDADGAALVVVATDDPVVNAAAAGEAEAAGALVNRADDGPAGDLTVMASQRFGPVTVAVDSGVNNPRVSKAVRAKVAEALDPAWIKGLVAEGRR